CARDKTIVVVGYW
nr:immunoglobulin heavy chain junction region [Macaca mulatta]MOV49049.1 immunoglobulin heavy chain junction region [Macaca mulatta]MOV50213.1 immunoglobulin heavy chain junction region [Macaca mulatta]MOV50670.1 immunoglobulin heavy chain junction region [Macaca mulatta]